jgi:hypothetical protein
MCDSLRIALWVGGAAVVLAAVCLVYFVSQNLGSRNIALELSLNLGDGRGQAAAA